LVPHGMTDDVEERWHDPRALRTWPVWQGAGWLLMSLALLSLGVPAMGVLGR
jgi:hypothetical protein